MWGSSDEGIRPPQPWTWGVIVTSGRFGYAESQLAASRRPSNEQRGYGEVQLQFKA